MTPTAGGARATSNRRAGCRTSAPAGPPPGTPLVSLPVRSSHVTLSPNGRRHSTPPRRPVCCGPRSVGWRGAGVGCAGPARRGPAAPPSARLPLVTWRPQDRLFGAAVCSFRSAPVEPLALGRQPPHGLGGPEARPEVFVLLQLLQHVGQALVV